MDSKAGNWVFDPLTDVRGLDREKKILDACLRRNDQRARECYMGTYKEPRVQQAAHPTWKNTSGACGRKVAPDLEGNLKVELRTKRKQMGKGGGNYKVRSTKRRESWFPASAGMTNGR